MPPVRVLLIAESANPEWPSGPLVGWSHSRALAERVDAHLVTQVRNRGAIERAGWVEGREFTAIDSERAAALTWRLATLLRGGEEKGFSTVSALGTLSYYYFEYLVWRRFGSAIRRGKYDVVHRLTPISPATPSPLARRCRRAGVPFVIGPLNGGVPWPPEFSDVRRAEREWLSYVRSAHKLLPGYRSTRRYSAAILVGSVPTWEETPPRDRHRCIYLPENAIDPEHFHLRRKRRAAAPLRCVFVGRLVALKGLDMLLRAAAELVRNDKLYIEIIGDGPERAALEEIVREEQLGSGVAFLGLVEHSDLQERLVDADLFTFPSIHEFGGGALLEAMAVGLVPLVVRYGGPAELVTPATGFHVELGTRDEIVAQLRAELERLVANPSAIDERSEPARRRIERLFTWEVKANQVSEVYDWVLGRRAEKPGWGMPFRDPDAG